MYNAADFRIMKMKNRTTLESGCFVLHPATLDLARQGCMRWRQVIGSGDAARRLSMFYAEVGRGTSPAMATGAGEAVLFQLQGDCAVDICGRPFTATAGSGVYVRRGESVSIVNASATPARWLIGICPRVEGLDFSGPVTTGFDARFPERVVASSGGEMHASGDRYYKLLVGPQNGSREVTQFIGMIPRSRAPEHFHLYEEAICILRGTGRMWTGEHSAEVGPGSIVFLPRRQPHSLECTCEEGLELVGLFYPAGSPAVNYRA